MHLDLPSPHQLKTKLKKTPSWTQTDGGDSNFPIAFLKKSVGIIKLMIHCNQHICYRPQPPNKRTTLTLFLLIILYVPCCDSGMFEHTVKPVKNDHSKNNKLVFKTNYRLMQAKSIGGWSKGTILQCFRPSLTYHSSLRSLFCPFWLAVLHM